jgi:hypothetical protein
MRWNYGFGQSIAFVSGKVDARVVQQKLRLFIEEWINSGFHPDGSEWPNDRNFAPKSCRKVWSFTDGKPNLFPPPLAVTAMAKFCNGALLVNGNSYQIVGHEEANTNSRVSVFIGPQGGIQYEPTSGSANDDPETMAAGIFLMFYRSKWLYRLMMCHHCGAFEVPKRVPRTSYVRGWHCIACSRKVPAFVSVNNSRMKRREEWLTLAVKACQKLKSRPQKADRVAWITSEVNTGLEALRSRERIKRNTITRNLTEIEKRAES